MTAGERERLAVLAVHWRDEASILDKRGATAQAIAIRSCACEMELEIAACDLETLTLTEAAAESGFSYSALEKGIRSGRIPNAGEHGRPRIQRCDLPRKPDNGGL